MTCWMFQNMYEAVTDPTKELLAEDTQVEADKSLVEFSTSAVAVMEDVGTVTVMIERSGLVHTEATIKVLIQCFNNFDSDMRRNLFRVM